MANFNAKRFGIQIIYRVCENQLWAPKHPSFVEMFLKSSHIQYLKMI